MRKSTLLLSSAKNLWLMVVLACGLTLSIASCKDDDNSNDSNEHSDIDPAETDEAVAALRWLVALTDTRELTDNWASKTYEPTVGQASTQNELNRVKVVNDLEEAKIDFASLAGIDTEGLDAAKTVTDEGVGTLTWTPSPGGADNLATVDVSSPLLPRLRQIIYCTSEQTGKNGVIFDNVKGTAYYRFGDVVRHDDGYYWVCVRPCFEPDKGDSHWINIFNASASGGGMKIPDKYLQKKWDKKDKYGNAPIVLPTKLPAEDQHTHNLSQLIQALLNPTDYENTYKHHSYFALGGFSPKYNGRLFVERVADYWDQPTANGYTVWQILFNRTREQMKEFTELDFFNQGYSWGLFDGNKATIYYYQSTEYRASYKSIRKMTFDVTRGFDVRAFAGDPEASTNIQKELVQFFDGITDTGSAEKSGRWLIRYASGKDLAGSILAPSPYEPLPNTRDVYVYNKETNKNVRTELETEEMIEEESKVKYEDWGSISPGTVIRDADGTRWICYSDWTDIMGYTTADHKARFISFDGLTTSTEVFANGQQGSFVSNADLMPEREAPVAAVILSPFTLPSAPGPVAYFQDKCKELWNIDLSMFRTERDSAFIYDGQAYEGTMYYLSLAYMPAAGRTPATQPYLRYVQDGSGIGKQRQMLPKWFNYPRLRFFKHYNADYRPLLDLAHPFAGSGFITEGHPVYADEFSSCVRTSTKRRDGDFTEADIYQTPYNGLLYNQQPAQYVTPYREHALLVRYLEFDDPSGKFRGTYGGKRYTLVSKPSGDMELTFRSHGTGQFQLSHSVNPGVFTWCSMDGQRVDLGYYSNCVAFPKADEHW